MGMCLIFQLSNLILKYTKVLSFLVSLMDYVCFCVQEVLEMVSPVLKGFQAQVS